MDNNERFKKDFDYLVCKIFKKEKKFNKETVEANENAIEKYATAMALKEIDAIRNAIGDTIVKIKDLALAQELVSHLLELDKSFEYMETVLNYSIFDEDNSSEFPRYNLFERRELLRQREKWITDIQNKYGTSKETNDESGDSE